MKNLSHKTRRPLATEPPFVSHSVESVMASLTAGSRQSRQNATSFAQSLCHSSTTNAAKAPAGGPGRPGSRRCTSKRSTSRDSHNGLRPNDGSVWCRSRYGGTLNERLQRRERERRHRDAGTGHRKPRAPPQGRRDATLKRVQVGDAFEATRATTAGRLPNRSGPRAAHSNG